MGADITWIGAEQAGDDEEFYFRDSYNGSNLAWVRGLSYWNAPETLEGRKALFESMALTTDEDIDAHIEKQMKKDEGNGQKHDKESLAAWKKLLREKRDHLVANMPFIRKAIDVQWSV
jgi:hypothetical protein